MIKEQQKQTLYILSQVCFLNLGSSTPQGSSLVEVSCCLIALKFIEVFMLNLFVIWLAEHGLEISVTK